MTRGPEKQFDPDAALEAAMEVFWAKGYEATSLAELLAAMGIARKSLYDTFGSKRELFERALDRYAERERARLEGIIAGATSPLEGVKAVIATWRQAGCGGERKGCMLGTNLAHFEAGDETMAARMRRHLDAVERALKHGLERARAAGEISEDADPGDLARLIASSFQGVAVTGRARKDGAVARSVERALLRVLETA
ncbi:MAG: TetR family transcriptional regulator [Planctomycetota bacterium]